MKVTIDIDCTPEEARTFFGLPNVTPINEALVGQIQDRIENGFDAKDVDQFMQNWIQGATTGMGEWQKTMMSLMQSAATGSSKG